MEFPSFVLKGLDWIELGGGARGEGAEQYPDRGAKKNERILMKGLNGYGTSISLAKAADTELASTIPISRQRNPVLLRQSGTEAGLHRKSPPHADFRFSRTRDVPRKKYFFARPCRLDHRPEDLANIYVGIYVDVAFQKAMLSRRHFLSG